MAGGGKRLTPDEIRRTKDAIEKLEKAGKFSQVNLAMELGISRGTVQHRLRSVQAGLYDEVRIEKEASIELPEFMDHDEPIEDILTRLSRHSQRRKAAAQARDWYPVKVNETRPYGILWFGDPHLGPHCDMELLFAHIEIAKQDGIYGANIGDTTDNWPWTGKLARLWAENDISHKTERRLATWFMLEAGIKWLVWLIGNHDEWNGGTEFYKMLGATYVPISDWRAQFRLVHPNGSETRIDAAHGRKGTSIYNPVHGTLREAKFGEDASLYITGHTHNYGLFDIEFAERRTRAWLAQISGYKTLDHYAKVKGFPESRHGAAVLSIVYPDTGKVQCFGDPEIGAQFLKALRA